LGVKNPPKTPSGGPKKGPPGAPGGPKRGGEKDALG